MKHFDILKYLNLLINVKRMYQIIQN